MNEEKIISEIKSKISEYGYEWRNPIGLYESESSTLFTSSSTNLFLPMIKKNCFSGSYVTIQPCLRTRTLKMYENLLYKNKINIFKSYFEILGTMEEGKLNKRTIKMVFSLFIDILNFKPSEFYIVIPKELEIFRGFIENEFGIYNIRIESNKGYTEWKYGFDFLKGVGISAYVIYNKNIIQIWDIIQINDIRFNKYYVEFCFSLENLKIKNENLNIINYIFNDNIEDISIEKIIFYDALIASCELYKAGIGLPKWKMNYQRSHIFKRFIKYLLVYGYYLGFSIDKINSMMILYLKNKYINEEKKDYEDIKMILNTVNTNIKKNTKKFMKYVKSMDGKYDRKECLEKFGILQFQIDYIL